MNDWADTGALITEGIRRLRESEAPMNEYISPKSMKHPPEGVLAARCFCGKGELGIGGHHANICPAPASDIALAEYRDGLRAEIAADRILSDAGAERLLHAIDNDGANRYEPAVCVHGTPLRDTHSRRVGCAGCFEEADLRRIVALMVRNDLREDDWTARSALVGFLRDFEAWEKVQR